MIFLRLNHLIILFHRIHEKTTDDFFRFFDELTCFVQQHIVIQIEVLAASLNTSLKADRIAFDGGSGPGICLQIRYCAGFCVNDFLRRGKSWDGAA